MALGKCWLISVPKNQIWPWGKKKKEGPQFLIQGPKGPFNLLAYFDPCSPSSEIIMLM